MENGSHRVTIHMAASLDGFIARTDGSVDWLETSDAFDGGAATTPEYVEEFLTTIDCYVMGSHVRRSDPGPPYARITANADRPRCRLQKKFAPTWRSSCAWLRARRARSASCTTGTAACSSAC